MIKKIIKLNNKKMRFCGDCLFCECNDDVILDVFNVDNLKCNNRLSFHYNKFVNEENSCSEFDC